MVNPTDYVFGGLVLLALLWELWTVVNRRPGDTISETIWKVSAKSRMIPFVLGVLIGHWFWCPCR